MMLLKLHLHRRMKVVRAGVKTSTSPPLSAEYQESTMSPQGKTYPSIVHTLINHQLHQHSRKGPHHAETDIAASHAVNYCSPVLMMRVMWDPNIPTLMLVVHLTGVQLFYHQRIIPSTACMHESQEQFYTDFKDVVLDNDTPSTEEHFSTAPLEDDVWSEDPFLDRQLCIHERPQKQNLKSSYPCSYSSTTFRMAFPQSTPQDATVLNYE